VYDIYQRILMEISENVIVGVVDDSRVNVRLLEVMLQKSGYTVKSAVDGTGAIELVDSHEIDILLLDIMMPVMDGIETCRKIKTTNFGKNLPVIFITALTETEEKLKAFEAGGVDYITKPFVREEVLARINVHIKLKQAMEKLEEISVTDELTGVFNRRFAYEMLYRMIENSRRDLSEFLICFIDVDNLKSVNDRFGHGEGDRLIGVVVNAVLACIRKTDYIFRMGGDEFLVLLPGASMVNVTEMINRITVNLKGNFIHDVPVSFSYGFADYDGRMSLTVDELINIADREMYEQKLAKKKHRGKP